MSGEEIERPQQTFSDELREEYSTNFSVAVTPHEIMIFFGKLSTDINDAGEIVPDKVEYHSKMQMSHEAARDLRDLLDANLGEGREARQS